MAVTNIDIVYFAEIVSRMRKWQKGFRIHGGKGNLEQVKYWEKKVDAFLAEYEKSKDNGKPQERGSKGPLDASKEETARGKKAPES